MLGQKSCWNQDLVSHKVFKAACLWLTLWLRHWLPSFAKWLQNAILLTYTVMIRAMMAILKNSGHFPIIWFYSTVRISRWGQSPRNSWQIFSQAWRLEPWSWATGPGGSCGLRESVPLVMWFLPCFFFLGSLETLWASPSTLVSSLPFGFFFSKMLWWCEYIFKYFPYSFSCLAF